MDQTGIARLRGLLEACGYPGSFSEMLLYPGQQRQQLMRWVLGRLLPCRDDLLQSSAIREGAMHDGSSEEQRFAENCQSLLALLGVPASVEAIRGGGPEPQRLQLLVGLLQLLRASAPHLAEAGAAAASRDGVSQLLDTACGVAGRLCSETSALFPADLVAEFERYRGVANTFASQRADLRRQLDELTARLQQLRAQGQPPRMAGGAHSGGRDGSSPGRQQDAAGAPDQDEWGARFDSLQEALTAFTAQAEALTQLYQQELSVWNPGEGGAAEAGGVSAVGPAAQQLLAAYQDLVAVLEAAGKLADAHARLGKLAAERHQQLEAFAQKAGEAEAMRAQAEMMLGA